MSRKLCDIATKLLFNNTFKSLSQFKVVTANYATFVYRDFMVDNFHGGSGTLINHYMKYIALENVKVQPVIKRDIKYAQFYPLHNIGAFKKVLRTVPSDQLPKLLIFTYTYKTNADVNNFVDAVNELDIECTRRLPEMDFHTILSLMYAFMYLIPNRITQTTFYQNSITKLINEFSSNATKSKFVEVCFYLGMSKKNRNFSDVMEHFLIEYFDRFLPELNSTDFGIVCNSAFKTSTRITSELYQDRIIKEIVEAKEVNIPLLITLIKSVRHNRVKSNEIQSYLKNILLNGSQLDDLDFKGLTHLFAYFSDNLFMANDIYEYFVETGMAKLESEDNIRPKDIATFIWSCSNLGLELLEKDDINLIAKIIDDKCENYEYKFCPDELVDSILSLWTMGYKVSSLVPMIYKNKNLFKTQRPDRVRLDSRLKLLLSCVSIEAPEVMDSIPENGKGVGFDEHSLAPDHLIKHRKKLQDVGYALKDLRDEFDITNINFVSPIKYLNIAGISVEFSDKKDCFIEVLDNSNTLLDRSTPTGLLKLKMRLLRHLGCSVIEVRFDLDK